MSLNPELVTVTQPKINETRLMAKSVTFLLSCFLSWILFCYIYLFLSVIVLQYHIFKTQMHCHLPQQIFLRHCQCPSWLDGTPPELARTEGKPCQGPELGDGKHSQLALASILGTCSWALIGEAGHFSGYMEKADRCPCLLAEGQETDRKQKCFLLLRMHPEPLLLLDNLSLPGRRGGMDWK